MRKTLMGIDPAELYRKVVETTEEGICIVGLDGRIAFANDSYCRLVGWDPREIIGLPIWENMPAEEAETYHSKGEKRSAGLLREHYELILFNRESKQKVYTMATVSPLFDERNQMIASMGVVTNITPLKLMQFELAKSVNRLKKAQSVARIGFWEQDLVTGEVTWSNELYSLLGIDSNQDISRVEYFMSLVHPEDRPALMRYKERAYGLGESYSSRYRFFRPCGDMIHLYSVVEAEKDQNGQVVRVNATLQDVSEQVQREQLMQEQKGKMLASAKLSALGEMAGGIAHEINTPLAVIGLNIGRLKGCLTEGVIDEAALIEGIEVIQKTTDRIAKIVHGLRSFSRDGSKDEFSPVNVYEMVEETLSFCNERFKNTGTRIIVEDLKKDLFFEGRGTEISQVLLNLLNNAYDAIAEAKEKWIRISAIDYLDHFDLMVTDCGKGVPAATREKIFQPFFTTKEIGKGTGMGLSISAGIVHSHKGELKLDTKSPNTCFVISLPKKQTSASAA